MKKCLAELPTKFGEEIRGLFSEYNLCSITNNVLSIPFYFINKYIIMSKWKKN